ncbi:MAG TPA: inositol monophosphatase [Paracoccaceae bacterium]|nr:inositol monophosphatase [Paracoccaceae bacterium]
MLTEARRSLLLEAVRKAARQAILPRFRNLAEGDVSQKSGPADLVTLADTEAEALITAMVAPEWPEAVVLGEEGVAADPTARQRMAKAEWAVIVDPVDGTWNFAKGLATFGVILAVCHKGQPVFAALYDPVMDDWVEASAGQGASLRGPSFSRPLRVSKETERRRMNGYIPMGLFPMETRRRLVQDFPDFGRVTSLRCSCHEYRMVAQGHSDFTLSGPTPHPWDHAAGALAVMEAGGVVRFLDGEAYRTERLKGVLLSASNEALWQELAARFAYLA